jgi:hypothetical protein
VPFIIYILCTLVLLSSLKACGIELKDVSVPHQASEALQPTAVEVETQLQAKDLQLECIQAEYTSEACRVNKLICRAAGCDGSVENMDRCKEYLIEEQSLKTQGEGQ